MIFLITTYMYNLRGQGQGWSYRSRNRAYVERLTILFSISCYSTLDNQFGSTRLGSNRLEVDGGH